VGVALIPELALSGVRQDISVRTLSPRPPARRVVAARAQRSHRSAAAPAMVEILRDVASRYRPLRVAA
jgi:DNA-binding transcriptional LysR family regulator